MIHFKVKLCVFELDIDIGTDELTGMDLMYVFNQRLVYSPAVQVPSGHTLNTAFQAKHC